MTEGHRLAVVLRMFFLVGLGVVTPACDSSLTLPVPPETAGSKSHVLEAFNNIESTGLYAFETGPLRADVPGGSRFELFAVPYSLQELGVIEGAVSAGQRALNIDTVFTYDEGAWSAAQSRPLEMDALPMQRCIDQGLCLGALAGQNPPQLSCVPCRTDTTPTPPELPNASCPADWEPEVVLGQALCTPSSPMARDVCSAGRVWKENLGCAEVSPCGASAFAAPRPGRNAVYVGPDAVGQINGSMAAPFAELADIPQPLPPATDVLVAAGNYGIDADLGAMTVIGNGACTVLRPNPQGRITSWTMPSLHNLTIIVGSELQLSDAATLSQVELRGPGTVRVSGQLEVVSSLVSLLGTPSFSVDSGGQLTVQRSDLNGTAIIDAQTASVINISQSRLLNQSDPPTSYWMISVEGGQASFDRVVFDGQDKKFDVGAISLTNSDATLIDVQAHNLDTFLAVDTGSAEIRRTVLTESDAIFDGRFADFDIEDLRLDAIDHPLADSLQTDISVKRAWVSDTSAFDSPSPGDVVFEDAVFVKGGDLSRYLFSSEGPGNLTFRRVLVQLNQDGFLFGGFTSALDVTLEDITVLGKGGTLGLSAEALNVTRAELLGFRQIRMAEAFLARQEPGSRWRDLRIEQSPGEPTTAALICLGKDHALSLERFDITSLAGAVVGLDLDGGSGLSASVFKDGVFRLPDAQIPYDLSGACTGSLLAPYALLPEHDNVTLQSE